MITLASNWDERESVGLDGPEVSIDGEVHLDDDVVVEEEPVVEPMAAPPRWRLLGRYVSIGRPNVDDMRNTSARSGRCEQA